MLFERPEAGNRAVVLHVELRGQANPDKDEFVELARSAEIDVVEVVLAPRDAPDARAFVGSGKVSEVKQTLRAADADLLLINHELSAGQQRNLEQALDCRVITRTELILTIFADRARSHEGQLQVELAQLKHAQTRLVRGWTHLDRQKGGIGMRGAGEKQIELDQRMLSERIKAVEKKIAVVSKRRSQNRRGRGRRGTPTVALVGYTNAGKSTLFNQMTNASVYAEDQLFATLDPTMRRIPVPGLNDVVLADTVGFVSLLPHALVEAFKATLEEVVHADLLLHVVDAADELHEERLQQVRDVLQDIGADEVPEMLVLNKIDLLPYNELPQAVQEAHDNVKGVFPVSAINGQGINALIEGIGAALGVAAPHQVVLDSADGRTRAWLYRSGAVLDEQTMEDGSLQLTLQADDGLLKQLQSSPQVMLRGDYTPPKISISN
ncbi:MAG: GTPase HflX [Pseudomonadaceae bacterium]|nr:GTPase HflX [Pseudomonadaceae bacterium]